LILPNICKTHISEVNASWICLRKCYAFEVSTFHQGYIIHESWFYLMNMWTLSRCNVMVKLPMIQTVSGSPSLCQLQDLLLMIVFSSHIHFVCVYSFIWKLIPGTAILHREFASADDQWFLEDWSQGSTAPRQAVFGPGSIRFWCVDMCVQSKCCTTSKVRS
jgi:hypothetical protein